jgi:phosphatidylserine/phosphatidylglycerophosphate/cardiolipin synthase-like enzyme
MNYTMNGVYRNNNNLMQIRSRRLVEAYQQEFEEMFTQRSFGITSPPGNGGAFMVEGTPISVYFASEDDVIGYILEQVEGAQQHIRFMAFSFTYDSLGEAMLQRAADGLIVEGVFETTGSGTEYSEMTRMACAGLSVMRDGNAGILHHKVIIIDDSTVITGSFNFSNSAVENNDENLLIIQDADLAALFIDEYQRVRALATPPNVTCDV